MSKKKPENHPKKSLLGEVQKLDVGETLTVSVDRLSYLKQICTTFGLQWGRRFSTSVNREARTITATRLA